jgi:hypothetical protein
MNNEDTRRILDLLAAGKITVDEAQQLIGALGEASASAAAGAPGGGSAGESAKPPARFLRITITRAPNDWRPHGKTVNIRVPMSMIRGGIQLGSLVPGLSEKLNVRLHPGAPPLDFSKLNPAELERVLREIDDLSIDVDGGKKQVQFHCE